MDWTWFLFRFNGRINRAKLWLALLAILCWMGFLAAMVAGAGKAFGRPSDVSFSLDDVFAALDPATYRGLSRADLIPTLIRGLGTPLFAWVYAATAVKRLHDRDMSGWWLVPFFVLPGLVNQFADRLGDGLLGMTLGTLAIIASFWGFIELYCLTGDRWPNRFGAPPLPKTQARPRAMPRGGQAWEQDRELEFVPRVGAPPLGGRRPEIVPTR